MGDGGLLQGELLLVGDRGLLQEGATFIRLGCELIYR